MKRILFLFLLPLSSQAAIDMPIIVNNQMIGILTADSFQRSPSDKGIEAQFIAVKPILKLAQEMGFSHFNWYQVVKEDRLSVRNSRGSLIKAPYIDPLCGGFGDSNGKMNDAQYSDNKLPYYEEAFSKQSISWSLWTANSSLFHLKYEDSPAPQPLQRLSFNTYLVGVDASGNIIRWFAGYRWSSISNKEGKSLKILGPKPIKGKVPLTEDFNDNLIRKSGYCINQKGKNCCWK